MNWSRCLSLILSIVFAASVASAQGKRIALTIDDAPHNGPVDSIAELRTMTKTFTETLTKHRVPAVVFVNEGQLFYRADEVEEKIAILKQWAVAGAELGNHTYGHVGLKDTPLEIENISAHLVANRRVGVPYTDDMIEKAQADFEAQSNPEADGTGELLQRYPKAKVANFDGDATKITELDAMIAYLQMLGTLVDFASFDAAGPNLR